MFDLRTILLILFLTLGFLSIALALPFIRCGVGPTIYYDSRTRVRLAYPGLWHDANTYAGKSLFGYGLGLSLASLILYFTSMSTLAYAWTCVAICLGGLAASVLVCFLCLRHRVNYWISKSMNAKMARRRI